MALLLHSGAARMPIVLAPAVDVFVIRFWAARSCSNQRTISRSHRILDKTSKAKSVALKEPDTNRDCGCVCRARRQPLDPEVAPWRLFDLARSFQRCFHEEIVTMALGRACMANVEPSSWKPFLCSVKLILCSTLSSTFSLRASMLDVFRTARPPQRESLARCVPRGDSGRLSPWVFHCTRVTFSLSCCPHSCHLTEFAKPFVVIVVKHTYV